MAKDVLPAASAPQPRAAAPGPDPRLGGLLLDTVEQAVVATNLEGVVTFWNRHAEHLYGWTRDEALGRPITELTPADTSREQAAAVMAHLRRGERWEGDMLVRRKDGGTFLAHVSDSPIHDPRGRLVGIVGVSTDVTETRALREARDRAVAQAERERARLRDVLHHTPALVAVLRGSDHVYELANPVYQALVGQRALLGRSVREAIPELEAQGFVALLDRVYRTGEPFRGTEMPVRLEAAGDAPREIVVNLVFQPLTGPAGAVDGVLVHGVEVTDLARARREAETARRAAEGANRAKSQFLANMSHEIRTPINAVIGYTELMQMGIAGPLTPAQRTHLERVRTSSAHLLGLVNEILDFAKIESGQLAVERRRVSLLPSVRAALAIVEAQASARGLVLDERVDCGEDAAYIGDEDRVRQVLLNLLTNAVKFTEPGGRITVRCRVEEAPPLPALQGPAPWISIGVEDTGIGIPPAALATIFDPFVQVDAEYTRVAGGTGLGLTISRRLARLMGGELTVRSEPGAGSVFTLWLPTVLEAAGVDDPHAVYLPHQVPGLAEVGYLLAENADLVTRRMADRLREEATAPGVRELDRAQLEDHTATFLVDIGLSLVALDEGGGEPALLQDGNEIQKVIADKHGAQRVRLGWPEEAMAREFTILREEVEAVLRREGQGRTRADLGTAITLVHGLLEHAERISIRGYRRDRG